MTKIQRNSERIYRDAESSLWQWCGACAEERWLELDAPIAEVRIQELGEGPPVLFVHGGPAAGAVFAPLAAQMGDYRCILLDRPGCGRSPPVPLSDYPEAGLDHAMSQLLIGVMRALGVDRVHLVGSSFGGSCALWLAERHPDAVASVVLMGCPAFLPGVQTPLFVRLLAAPAVGFALARVPLGRRSIVSMLRSLGHGSALDARLIPEPFIEWWLALQRHTRTIRSDREMIRTAVSLTRGMRQELSFIDEQLEALHTPTLWYWGAHEPMAPVTYVRDLTGRMRAAQMELVPGAGHLPWIGDPRAAADSIRTFFRAIDASPHRRLRRVA